VYALQKRSTFLWKMRMQIVVEALAGHWRWLLVTETDARSRNRRQTVLPPWSESASEQPSDRRLPAKWLPTFADRGCHVVSVTDPNGCIPGFLDRSSYFSIKVAPQLYSRGWVDPVPDPLLFFLVVLGIEPGPPETVLQRYKIKHVIQRQGKSLFRNHKAKNLAVI
jgi:hypothetical protein